MFFKAAWLDFLSPAGELVLITSLLLSHLFSNEKQARGFSIGSPIVWWFCLPVRHSRRFLQIRNGRESPIIGEPNSVAPPPVVADLMETVLLWFSFPFHGFHEARNRTGVFTDSLFSPLIIALLDLGGISFYKAVVFYTSLAF